MTDSINRKGLLCDRVAVVTGGGSGIGRSVCLTFAREGAAVAVVDIDSDGVNETIDSIRKLNPSAGAIGPICNVCNERDMERMAHQTLEQFGRIDVLVASAGILRARGTLPKPAVDITGQEWDEVINTNLKGVFLSNRAVLPSMIQQRRGDIVNISSTAGWQGRAHDSPYCASKFGVIGLSEALGEEVRQYGVRVQIVLPDAVNTPIWKQNGPIRPEAALDTQRVADLILYLVTLPIDTLVPQVVLAPFRARRRVGMRTN